MLLYKTQMTYLLTVSNFSNINSIMNITSSKYEISMDYK